MTQARIESLTDDERAEYERNGFLVLPSVFGETELELLRRESDRLADLLVNASLATGVVSPRLDIRRDESGPVLLKIQPLSDVSAVFARAAQDERLLEPMRALLGTEPVLLEEKLNGKEQLNVDLGELPVRDWAPEFPFHTDLHYFVLDGYPESTLSSAIALDECTADNGPLRFIPGSHRRPHLPLRGGWPPDLADGLFEPHEEVPLLCPAGTLVLFHSRVAHASSANRSGRPRRLLIYSHFPATHDAEPDARNRALRAAGRRHERSYAAAVAAGYAPVPVRAGEPAGEPAGEWSTRP